MKKILRTNKFINVPIKKGSFKIKDSKEKLKETRILE